MKNLLIIIFVVFVQKFFGQQKILFQSKEQTIFIDYSKNSEFFKRRKNYEFSRKYNDSLIIDTLNIFKKQNSIQNFNMKNFPKKWIELFIYKGKYYTYHPCEFCGDVDNLEIENSVYFIYRCELLDLYKIERFKKQKNNFEFEISNNFEKAVVKINMIDLEKGIAVFETKIDDETSYKLMLDVSKIDKFPMIVNDCKSKQREFKEFEKPNFKKLLNQK